jgi:hypothetical protein
LLRNILVALLASSYTCLLSLAQGYEWLRSMVLHLCKSVSCRSPTDSRSASCGSIWRSFSILSFSFRRLSSDKASSISCHSHGSTRSTPKNIWQELILILLLLAVQCIVSIMGISHLAYNGSCLEICVSTILPCECLAFIALIVFIGNNHWFTTYPTSIHRYIISTL